MPEKPKEVEPAGKRTPPQEAARMDVMADTIVHSVRTLHHATNTTSLKLQSYRLQPVDSSTNRGGLVLSITRAQPCKYGFPPNCRLFPLHAVVLVSSIPPLRQYSLPFPAPALTSFPPLENPSCALVTGSEHSEELVLSILR